MPAHPSLRHRDDRRAARSPRCAPAVLAAATLVLFNLPGPAQAQTAALPAEVRAQLKAAKVPEDALAVVVQEIASREPALAHQSRALVNPASVVKLATTYAALDQLGPAWTWATPVWLLGPVREGVLDGSLVIKGQGDPKLVLERVWLMLRRVQQLGVREIRGDIVLDRTAFAPAEGSAADFDGDATRPYNVRPDALLLNYKAVTYSFVPEPARNVARVIAEPDLSAGRSERTVPLTAGPCDDWRTALKATADGTGYRFGGSYPAACGEQAWPLADPDAATYNARLVEALWRDLGGRLGGSVHDGVAPAGSKPSFELRSPALAEVVRDINKFSNNVMAQQLFLSLAPLRQPGVPASAEGARDALRRWAAERGLELPAEAVIDNGSGLSRQTRVTAQWLAQLLISAWGSPVMPELMSSLPVNGLDGTMRRSRATPGRAHLKTGSLRDVAGVAGYVLSDGGRRWVLVAILNHPNANAARPALDALVQWVMRDGNAR